MSIFPINCCPHGRPDGTCHICEGAPRGLRRYSVQGGTLVHDPFGAFTDIDELKEAIEMLNRVCGLAVELGAKDSALIHYSREIVQRAVRKDAAPQAGDSETNAGPRRGFSSPEEAAPADVEKLIASVRYDLTESEQRPMIEVDRHRLEQAFTELLSLASETREKIIERALLAASPLILQAWADRCGIDVNDERVQEANKVGWPHDYGLFEAGWNALVRALKNAAPHQDTPEAGRSSPAGALDEGTATNRLGDGTAPARSLASAVRANMQPHFDVLASICQYFHSNGMVEDKRRLDATITAFGKALEGVVSSARRPTSEFVATVAAEYGPEAAEAVGDALRAERDDALEEAASFCDGAGGDAGRAVGPRLAERIRAMKGVASATRDTDFSTKEK